MGLGKRCLDMQHHAVEVRHHIVMGDAQDFEAERAAIVITPFVMTDGLIMTGPINFYDEAQFSAEKVSKIGADRHLAAELVS